jgi:Na+/melibiose symporter-like transporter
MPHAPDVGTLPLVMKLAYGFGAVAYCVKGDAFSVFLLFFYSRSIGMPAEQVGLAIMLVLIVDAISDPLGFRLRPHIALPVYAGDCIGVQLPD